MNLKEKLIRWVPSNFIEAFPNIIFMSSFHLESHWSECFVVGTSRCTQNIASHWVHCNFSKNLFYYIFKTKFHWVDSRVHLFQKSFRFLKRSPSLKDALSNWSSAAYWSNKSIVNQGLSDRYFYPKKWMECQVHTDFFAHNFIYAFNSH